MDIDIDWCLTCEKHINGPSPYCSLVCKNRASPSIKRHIYREVYPEDFSSFTFHDHTSCHCPRTFITSGNPQASAIRNIHRTLAQHEYGTNISNLCSDRIFPRHSTLLQPCPNRLREPKTIRPRGHVCSGPLLGLSLASTHPFNSEAATAGHANKSAKSHTQASSQPVSARDNHGFPPFLSWFYK